MSPAMTPELWRRVTEVLDQVLACDPSERQALLDEVEAEAPDLRTELESLLRYEDARVSVLESPTHRLWGPRPYLPNEEQVPVEINGRIGHYRVRERLGVGGMGVVYLAVREDDFRKKVALKLIRKSELTAEMSAELLFRFRNERQILADLDHPNIARILDAGTTPDGLPYFAMDYIEGQPINTYCDEHRLSLNQRLDLFLQICAALQAAHQNLVVHRDLKPNNILVTKEGVPKLIDFGIAKNLNPEAIGRTAATVVGMQPMTLRYASPEQLEGHPITPSVDIYALGVLLYQLLTGHDPYPFDRGLVALHRSICEEIPKKPSIAVQEVVGITDQRGEEQWRTPETVSEYRNTDPERLALFLAGDLDSILLKILRKEPEQRYRSVEGLAEDIQRFLHGLPVHAHEGNFSYLATKFIRRNRWALAALTLIVLIVFASGLSLTLLWRRAVQEEARSTKTRAKAERTADLLVSLIEVFDPQTIGDSNASLSFLKMAQQELMTDLQEEPELLARLLNDPLSKVYRRWGYYPEALEILRKAMAVSAQQPNPDQRLIAEILHNEGAMLYRMGDSEGAEWLERESLKLRRQLGLPEGEWVGPLNTLAAIQGHRGQLEEAASGFRQVLDIQRRRLGEGSPQLAIHQRNLAMLEFTRNQLHSAELLLRQALRLQLQSHGAESLEVASTRSDLGRILHARGNFLEAEQHTLQALDIRQKLLGAEHVDCARAQRNLALILLSLGSASTAQVLLDQAQPALRRAKPAEDWEVQELDSLLGALALERGDRAFAEDCLVASARALEKARGRDVIYSRHALARMRSFFELRW